MAIPDLIRIVRRGDFCHVYIDGEELPGSIPRDDGALVVTVDPDALPSITVKLQAHRVDVVNDIEEGGEGDGAGTEPVDGADQRDGPSA
ncbi:hypothetical protein [Streptomyces sp. CC219B]|uniref:hypothetical protein n=1 Tax=Streptomyces sp. CC219B TaxID=3044574 RepID=UPI0024A83A3F|nr:hypothetical protein [Streptomyces sp. CC219B]